MLIRLIIYVIYLRYVCGYKYHSTVEALVLETGKRCMGDCLFSSGVNRCTVDWSGNEKMCKNNSNPTLRYTTLTGVVCASNCDTFNGENYDWCATYDGSLSWNKCSRYIARTGREVVASNKEYLVCSDECSKRGYSYYWCNTVSNWQYCSPENKIIVYDHPTKTFRTCSSPCVYYKDEPHCYNDKGDWEQCYLNPDNRDILTSIEQHIQNTWPYGEYGKNGYIDCKIRSKRSINLQFFWPLHQDVPSLAIEYERLCPQINVTDPNNPVYSYTMLPIPSPDQLNLPLVVRARIYPRHLRYKEREYIPTRITKHVNRMNRITDRGTLSDERGHLLASMIGGPTEPYNFIPQAMIHNRGHLSRWNYLERDLFRFLNRSSTRYVDWTAVISYNFDADRPFRPTAVAIGVRFYDNQILVSSRGLESMFFTNNPNSSCKIEGDEDDPISDEL